jgi:hypothetical protein
MSYAISAGSTAALPLSMYDPYKVTHDAQPRSGHAESVGSRSIWRK